MSYQHHDHAEWVERNNAAINRVWLSSRSKRKPATLPEKLTPFQAKAMDILGITFGGIYNAPIRWEGIDYMSNDYAVIVPLEGHSREFATWDFNKLTMFVFLCHEARIRGALQADKFKPLTIFLSPRSHDGSMSVRHPSLDEAVRDFRAYLPSNHRVTYCAAVTSKAAIDSVTRPEGTSNSPLPDAPKQENADD